MERAPSNASEQDDGPTPKPSASPLTSDATDESKTEEVQLASSPPSTPTLEQQEGGQDSLKLPEPEDP